MVQKTAIFLLTLSAGLTGTLRAQSPGDLLWQNSAGWFVQEVTAGGDANSDGRPDVFIGSSNNAIYCYAGLNGEQIWNYTTQGDVWSVANISDVNSDGIDDCLAGCADNYIYCISGQSSTGEGALIWSFKTKGDVWVVSAIGDVNGDGIKDALGACADNNVYCLNGATGQKIWTYTDNSDVLDVQEITDVNADGVPDCLAGGHGDKIRCLSGSSGAVIWQYTMGTSVTGIASVSDVNGDGVPDCFACGLDERVFCISGSNGTQIWSYSTPAWIQAVAAIGDVNGDGKPDCLAGGMDNYVHCLSGATGNPIWSFRTGSTVRTVAAIPDVNNDGMQDCIAGGEDNAVYCLDGNAVGSGSLLWSNSATGTVLTVAAIGDISGNGAPDVLAGSDDSYVYAFEGGEGVIQAESVSAPTTPAGPGSGQVGQSISFIASGAASNLGHSLEYQFDWDDGSQSGWAAAQQTHLYISPGSYSVKARARCQSHHDIYSSWSAPYGVQITGHTISLTINGSGSVTVEPNKSEFDHNETITLTAVPAEGYSFTSWSDDIIGTSNPVSVSISNNLTVTATFSSITETVSTPTSLNGPAAGDAGETLTFTTGGAVSSLGHSLEYRFDWGDGTLSSWGGTSRSHQFGTAGTYIVRSRARCGQHTSVQSDWYSGSNVTVQSTGVEIASGSGVPTQYHLSQNYPNPFNGGTSIEYSLPKAATVQLDIYSVRGEHVITLVSGPAQPGVYHLTWKGRNQAGDAVSSGLYLLQIVADNYRANRTMLYLK